MTRDEAARTARLGLEALVAIKSRNLPHGSTGSIPCPACGKTMRFRMVGLKRKVRARCETEGCIELLENCRG